MHMLYKLLLNSNMYEKMKTIFFFEEKLGVNFFV